MISAMLGICLPTFVLGPLLILIFFVARLVTSARLVCFFDMILPSLLPFGFFMVPTSRGLLGQVCLRRLTKITFEQHGRKELHPYESFYAMH